MHVRVWVWVRVWMCSVCVWKSIYLYVCVYVGSERYSSSQTDKIIFLHSWRFCQPNFFLLQISFFMKENGTDLSLLSSHPLLPSFPIYTYIRLQPHFSPHRISRRKTPSDSASIFDTSGYKARSSSSWSRCFYVWWSMPLIFGLWPREEKKKYPHCLCRLRGYKLVVVQKIWRNEIKSKVNILLMLKTTYSMFLSFAGLSN